MAGRKRKIYFFEPITTNADEIESTMDATFWPSLHDHVASLEDERLRNQYLGHKYAGAARKEVSPAEKFFYIGKTRNGADWPDMQREGSDPTALELAEPGAGLVEPAYLLPISGTPYVAALRTTAGPSWSAIENWLAAVSGMDVQGETFELRPYVRHDQLARLHAAIGVSKLHLKVEPGSDLASGTDGVIGTAMREVQDLGAGGVTVDIQLSFGHARPDEAAAAQIAAELQSMMGNVKFRSASATLLSPTDEEGMEYKKDAVDFFKDRVTGTALVGTSEDERPTAPAVLKAMTEAIRMFRESNLQ
jgi:hypothetical protein